MSLNVHDAKKKLADLAFSGICLAFSEDVKGLGRSFQQAAAQVIPSECKVMPQEGSDLECRVNGQKAIYVSRIQTIVYLLHSDAVCEICYIYLP